MGKKKEESSIDSGPFDTAREMNILWIAGDVWKYLGCWEDEQTVEPLLEEFGHAEWFGSLFCLGQKPEVFLFQLMVFVS